MKLAWLPTVAIIMVVLLWVGGNAGYAVMVALFGVLTYTLEVIFFPMGKCGWCDHGKQWSPFTHSFKVCRHCGGAGVRPRLGHRFWKRDE